MSAIESIGFEGELLSEVLRCNVCLALNFVRWFFVVRFFMCIVPLFPPSLPPLRVLMCFVPLCPASLPPPPQVLFGLAAWDLG